MSRSILNTSSPSVAAEPTVGTISPLVAKGATAEKVDEQPPNSGSPSSLVNTPPHDSSPAFQFYPKDFLSDENQSSMTLQETGAYIRLICRAWLEGSIPTDVGRLARLCGVPPHEFRKIWPAVQKCFINNPAQPDRLIHARLNKERLKQQQYRRRQADAAASRWHKPDASRGDAGPMPKPCSSSPISDLQSSSSTSVRGTARSKRPIFSGQRVTVFEWMLDDSISVLGPHAEAFDLDSWFRALDLQAVADGIVVPKRDSGAWLQAQLVAEAQRRGLPIRLAIASQPGKQTSRLATAIANIRAEDGR